MRKRNVFFPAHAPRMLGILACFSLLGCNHNWTKSFTTRQQDTSVPAVGDPFVAAFRKLRPSIAMVTVDVIRRPAMQTYGTASVVKSDRRGSWLITAAHVVANARAVHVRIGLHP